MQFQSIYIKPLSVRMHLEFFPVALFTISIISVSENVRAMKPGIKDFGKWLIKQTHHYS